MVLTLIKSNFCTVRTHIESSFLRSSDRMPKFYLKNRLHHGNIFLSVFPLAGTLVLALIQHRRRHDGTSISAAANNIFLGHYATPSVLSRPFFPVSPLISLPPTLAFPSSAPPIHVHFMTCNIK